MTKKGDPIAKWVNTQLRPRRLSRKLSLRRTRTKPAFASFIMQTQHLTALVHASESASSCVSDSAASLAHPQNVTMLSAAVATPPLSSVASPELEPLPPILIADDDMDDRFFIERLIKRTGVKNPVKAFEDGSEVVNYLGARLAMAAGSHRMPELLFLDLRMAGLGGFGFLEWAQQQRGLLPLTIVVLSSSNLPADVARAHELGAHRYLVKYPCVQTINTIVRSVYPQTVF